MAYLGIVGSFSVNGVAALHSRLLQQGLFRDFFEMWPEKFNNKTNGVTQRRWLAYANPLLAELISSRIGSGWTTDLTELKQLKEIADDGAFQQQWKQVKRANKELLADFVADKCGVAFPLDSMFDVQVKRIHEYKRQLLNVLHVIHLYNRIKQGDTDNWVPRAIIIGGKAAPGYAMAKMIIKLVNNVATVINHDPQVGDLLKVVFLPNYNVSAMEIICAGTDLSEQISTAGKEASGTGNMKFMMNGAMTIGTLDGANIEMREEVGAENFFLFGLSAEEVEERRRHYDPAAIVAGDKYLAQVMQLLQSGHFNQFEPGIFDSIIRAIFNPDDLWMVAADFDSYRIAQEEVSTAYRDQQGWTRMSILNSAASGKFSTDRTMRQYNEDIWRLQAVPAKKVGDDGKYV
jgi:starch phosphorylase